ncbi:MAG: HAD-IA family hydrolase [Candidatus Aenigmarchaeota archaeon]|nr:HAD-IA family hydrolase [Candidatus Aenigmarchaeota archaeon]
MKAVIFDLDNTLYDHSKYLLGAFRDVSKYLSHKHSLNQRHVYKVLVSIWKKNTSMYPRVFNDLLDQLSIKEDVINLVNIFNAHVCNIAPYKDVRLLIKKLKKQKFLLGLITDGTVDRQKRKLSALKLQNSFDVIIFTKEIGHPKPSHKPFLQALYKLGVKPENTFYIGDNPIVDFEGSKKVGMHTIRLLKGEFRKLKKNKYIDYEVKEIIDIMKVIM